MDDPSVSVNRTISTAGPKTCAFRHSLKRLSWVHCASYLRRIRLSQYIACNFDGALAKAPSFLVPF